MTNEELVTRIQAGENDLILILWEATERFVKQQANKWKGSAEFDDLVQQGFLILYDAAADYEQGQGVTFIYYLGQRLAWGWARWLEETGAAVRLPSYMVGQIRQYNRIRRDYTAEHGQEPPERVLCRQMGISWEQLRQIQETAVKTKIRSLNERLEADDGSGEEIQDMLPDSTDITQRVLDSVQQEQLARVIWPMVDELGERQARVIWQRYKKNKTQKECGEALGVSTEAVRQIEQKAMRELRRTSNARKLQPFLDDIRSAAMRGVGVSRFNQTWTSATEREALRRVERQRSVKPRKEYTEWEIESMLADLQRDIHDLREKLAEARTNPRCL